MFIVPLLGQFQKAHSNFNIIEWAKPLLLFIKPCHETEGFQNSTDHSQRERSNSTAVLLDRIATSFRTAYVYQLNHALSEVSGFLSPDAIFVKEIRGICILFHSLGLWRFPLLFVTLWTRHRERGDYDWLKGVWWLVSTNYPVHSAWEWNDY